MLANNDKHVPDALQNKTIYELPLANIVSGSKYVGDVEKKIQAIIDFAMDEANNAIIFIDELHLLGSKDNYSKIAQILKPALARGDIRCIGATTTQEVNNLQKDPAFNRRFSRIIVNELTPEETEEIVKLFRNSLCKYHKNVMITDEMCAKIVHVADQVKSAGSHRPDNAITLLDRAVGDAIIERKNCEINAENDPILKTALSSNPPITLTDNKLKATAVRIITGVEKIPEFSEKRLRDNFAHIHGQDNVVETVVDILKRNYLNIFPTTQPTTLLFAGTSGVGKTEIAKIISHEITGSEPIILNMAEYHSSASINRIIGAPAGYVGSDANTELPFDSLSSNPYKVILLDEFEKCDKSVQRLFMSAFDEGTMKTNRGDDIDFSKSIIIATTNAAHKDIKNNLGFTDETGNEETKTDLKALTQWFDAELLNRFSKILTFNALSETTYADIVSNLYTIEAKRINKSNIVQLPTRIDKDDLSTLVKSSYVAAFGARPAKKIVKKYIEEQFLTLLKQDEN